MPRVLMGLMFFPRGGSSQVARYLARSLPESGWDVTLACGSLGPPGAPSNAATFFSGLDVRALDFGAAAEAPDPLAADPPFHPSFEDRPGAPDRVFARLGRRGLRAPGGGLGRQLAAAGAAEADLLHLHHLTPINEAAERAFPDVPRIGHLHGTELLMLREIDGGPARGLGRTRRSGPSGCGAGPRPASGCSCSRPTRCGACPDLLGVAAGAGGLGAERLRPAGASSAGRWPATRGSPTGGAGSWRSRAAGTSRGEPGSVAYSRRAARAVPRRRAACCSTWGATPRSSASRC